MRKIGLYLRVSTEEQARVQEGSLISQRHRLEEYVKVRNAVNEKWGEIVGIYVDEAKSGKDTNRPKYQELLKSIENSLVNTVLVTELSRLSRSIRDFCDFWDFLKIHQAQFLSLREQFDTTTAAGEMMMFSIMNFAQFERKQTAERVAANFLARAKRGLYNGGQLPLGYDTDPENRGSLKINASEAVHVNRIFELFLEHGTLRATADHLNKEGIRTKKWVRKDGITVCHGKWTPARLWYLLRNRHYIGDREINKDYRAVDPSQVPNGREYQVVKAKWLAIVPEEIFAATQKQLQFNRARYTRRPDRVFDYIYSGVVHCGDCGEDLIGLSGTNRHGMKYCYYSHRKRRVLCSFHGIPALKLHDYMQPYLKQIVRDQDVLTRLYEEVRQGALDRIKNKIEQRRHVTTELNRVNRNIRNLVEHLKETSDKHESAALLTELNANEASLKFLSQEKETLDLEINFADAGNSSEACIHQYLGDAKKWFDSLLRYERARLVRLWFKRIDICAAKVKLYYFHHAHGEH